MFHSALLRVQVDSAYIYCIFRAHLYTNGTIKSSLLLLLVCLPLFIQFGNCFGLSGAGGTVLAH